MKKMIFVTGLPRAMTTLMCNILANNPRIGGGETSPLIEYVHGARGNFSTTPEVRSALTKEIMHDAFIKFCQNGMQGYAEAVTPKEIYLDKSRGWIYYSEFLREIIPDAKIIVMIRDLRSIMASLEKKWRENPAILDARDVAQKEAFITVDQRVNQWAVDPPLSIAIKRLYNAWQTKAIKNMHVVRAEKLCKDPKRIMEDVYDFIEEPYYNLDYNDVKQFTVENDRIADFGIYGDHNIRGKVEPMPKDYEEILGTTLSNSMKANYKWFYEAFGYF